MIRILIADDHQLIAEGIKQLLERENDLNVIEIVNNGQEVLQFIEHIQVDVILLDIDMPIMNGIDCAKEVIKRNKNIKIAILTMHEENAIARQLVKMGVDAYLLKSSAHEELIRAIRSINNGSKYFTIDMSKLMDEDTIEIDQEELSTLSKRELEILTLIAGGKTNPQIAEQLFISPKTVDAHRTNIMRKLDLHNVASLIRFAFKHKLVE